jgi:large subunit ribosomal protein L17
VHARRLAASRLRARGRSLELSKEQRKKWRQDEDVVRILFDELAPVFKERRGGYTRIIRLGERRGDVAKQAILEWVDVAVDAGDEPAAEAAPAKAAEKTEAAESAKA